MRRGAEEARQTGSVEVLEASGSLLVLLFLLFLHFSSLAGWFNLEILVSFRQSWRVRERNV